MQVAKWHGWRWLVPVHVEKRGGSEKPYKIVEEGGKVVGSSKTRENAQHSANARNASKHGWHPTKNK